MTDLVVRKRRILTEPEARPEVSGRTVVTVTTRLEFQIGGPAPGSIRIIWHPSEVVEVREEP